MFPVHGLLLFGNVTYFAGGFRSSNISCNGCRSA